MTASTYERLKKIVVEQLGVDEDDVKPEASFVDDLNADSLDLVELVMSLEEEFGTEISDEDAEKIRTVQDAVDYIDEHLQPVAFDRASTPASAEELAERLGARRSTTPPARAGARPQQLRQRAPRRGHRRFQRAPRVPGRRRDLPDRLRGPLLRHPDEAEGVLTTRRAAIVSTRGLARIGAPHRPRRSARARRRAPSAPASGAAARCWPAASRRSWPPSTSTGAGRRPGVRAPGRGPELEAAVPAVEPEGAQEPAAGARLRADRPPAELPHRQRRRARPRPSLHRRGLGGRSVLGTGEGRSRREAETRPPRSRLEALEPSTAERGRPRGRRRPRPRERRDQRREPGPAP